MGYICKGDTMHSGGFLETNCYLKSANAQFYLVMQEDGNLCLFRGSEPGNNSDLLMWCSQTSGGVSFLTLQGDGNLCIYGGHQLR